MRSLGLVLSAFLVLAACAKDPDYATGTAGSSGGPAGSGGGGPAGSGSGGSGLTGYIPPTLTITTPNPIVSRGAQVFAMPDSGTASIVDGKYHAGGWIAGKPTD